jgi:hypothetical protein
MILKFVWLGQLNLMNKLKIKAIIEHISLMSKVVDVRESACDRFEMMCNLLQIFSIVFQTLAFVNKCATNASNHRH